MGPGGAAQVQATTDTPEADDDAFDDGPEEAGDGFEAAEPALPVAPEPVVHASAPFAAAASPVLEEPASAPAVSAPEPTDRPADAPPGTDTTPPAADPSDR